ncbi:TPA: hypothetical protein EYH33_04580, partial [Candidatus Bipolaricaulota bacterium]|nr:hypothetical protein [Candidatus Bipolaricaulota bacterium]
MNVVLVQVRLGLTFAVIIAIGLSAVACHMAEANKIPGLDFVLVPRDSTLGTKLWNIDAVKAVLDELKVPYYVILSNHDISPVPTKSRPDVTLKEVQELAKANFLASEKWRPSDASKTPEGDQRYLEFYEPPRVHDRDRDLWRLISRGAPPRDPPPFDTRIRPVTIRSETKGNEKQQREEEPPNQRAWTALYTGHSQVFL